MSKLYKWLRAPVEVERWERAFFMYFLVWIAAGLFVARWLM